MKTTLGILFAFSMIISIAFLGETISSNNSFSAQAQTRKQPSNFRQPRRSQRKLNIPYRRNKVSGPGQNRRNYDTGGGGGVGGKNRRNRQVFNEWNRGSGNSNRLHKPIVKNNIARKGNTGTPFINVKIRVQNPARRRPN